MELGETMADNLVAKGVTASASDGLTTLAGKILDIQTGGSCYHIELNESAYTTTGSLTVTATLQNQYQPYANQTVTFTGGTSTVTATTDSNGVATATVTFSASGTLTASYSNVSDTATVTVQTGIFFEDDFSSATLNSNWKTHGASPTTTISNGQLTMYKSSSGVGGIYYDTLVTGDYKITIDVVTSNYNSYLFGMQRNGNNNGYDFYQTQPNYSFEYINENDNGSETSAKNYGRMSISHNNSTIVIEVIKDTSVKIYKGTTLQKTYTLTNGTTDGYIGFKQCCSRNLVISSIKVEAL